jgi:hypothetical protein
VTAARLFLKADDTAGARGPLEKVCNQVPQTCQAIRQEGQPDESEGSCEAKLARACSTVLTGAYSCRAECQRLYREGSLKKGLSVDDCVAATCH